jgi:cell division protein FtsB
MSVFSKIVKKVLPVGLSRIKLVIIALIMGGMLASGLGMYFYVSGLKKEISSLQTQVNMLTANNSVLISNNATLKSNLAVAVQTNNANVDTIDKLLKERKSAVDMVDKLAKAELINKKKIKDLKDEVNKLKGDPTRDGPLAPVLRDTLYNVQNLE